MKINNAKLYRATAAVMLAVMLLLIPYQAIAVEVAEKEESIYATLNWDGSFDNAYIVNAFSLKAAGIVEDYGDYDEVRNLTTTDRLTVNDCRISINAPEGRFYYQGNLGSMELPWIISVAYFLDGKEVAAEQLSGAGGFLEIRIGIKKNSKAKNEFAEHYMLQTSVKLDAGLCTEIDAPGASVVNAGGSKVVNFTLLPDTEDNYLISAQVKDFYMDGMQFAGIPFSMNTVIERPDVSSFTGRLDKLVDGIGKLDDGARDLMEGSDKLRDGGGKLRNGIRDMGDGISKLSEGLQTLTDQNDSVLSGADEIRDGFAAIIKGLKSFSSEEMDFSQLTDGSAAISEGLKSLTVGLSVLNGAFRTFHGELSQRGLERDAILSANSQMIMHINGQLPDLYTAKTQIEGAMAQGMPGLEADYENVLTQIGFFEQIIMLLTGNSGLIQADAKLMQEIEDGVNEIMNGSATLYASYRQFDEEIQKFPSMMTDYSQSALEPIGQLRDALVSLSAGYDEFRNGVAAYMDGASKINDEGFGTLIEGMEELLKGGNSLYSGLSEFYDGMGELAEGTGKLKSETSSMDEEIEKAIDEVVDEMVESYLSNDDFELVSFISPKNKNVKAVQFIMQTREIERKDEAETVPEKERVELSFWKRLLALFGL